jgi:aminobenzoyl-glutamate utilization protein B
MRITIGVAVLALAAVSLPAQPTVSKEKEATMKADLIGQIDGMKKQAQVMVDTVFSFGELGFQEVQTSKYLSELLEKNGFQVERGVAGIPTAFMATWGPREARHRARLRHRRHTAGITEAGRGLSRPHH